MALQETIEKEKYVLVFSLLLTLANCASLIEEEQMQVANETIRQLPEVHDDSFYYFSFGSNMLTKRIQIQNPTAMKIGAAKLDNYRLDFYGFTRNWYGAPATIVPNPNATTYGCLWSIKLSNLADIDDQESVNEHIYTPISLPIKLLSNDTTIIARAYHLVEQPGNDFKTYDNSYVPQDRRPSKTYLQCLVKGAQETGLPSDYIRWLQSIKHNNWIAPRLEKLLELQNVELFFKI